MWFSFQFRPYKNVQRWRSRLVFIAMCLTTYFDNNFCQRILSITQKLTRISKNPGLFGLFRAKTIKLLKKKIQKS